ncbi:unnamed protein product [Merluccius merluccius]
MVVRDEDPVAGGLGRPSWPALLLVVLAAVAVAAASLSALTLRQLLALRADVEVLKSELCRRREAWHTVQSLEPVSGRRAGPEHAGRAEDAAPRGPPRRRRRRGASETPTPVAQPCLQMLADSNKETFQEVFASQQHTGIPWQEGLSRGSALELNNNRIRVREEGFYFLYSQVFYIDSIFAMGHVVIRRKRNVVGTEPQHVILFRCIQNMSPVYPANTCFTGGIVKLEVDDEVELLIPRATANVSLSGDATFLGALKLA